MKQQVDFYKLLQVDSSRSIADMAMDAVGNDVNYFREVFRLAATEKPPLCWRAARVVDLCSEKHPFLMYRFLPDAVDLLVNTSNSSLKRIFTRILIRYIPVVDEDLLGIVTDYAFSKAENTGEPVAVRAFALDMLEQVGIRVPELQDEVRLFMQNLSEQEDGNVARKAGKMSTGKLKFG